MPEQDLAITVTCHCCKGLGGHKLVPKEQGARFLKDRQLSVLPAQC